MAGVKSAKKGRQPTPSLTNRRCVKCENRIMSNEIATILLIDMAERTRTMAFYHRGCR
jgi:hypothetical protein